MDKTVIPKGHYCYSGGEWTPELGIYRVKPCPYWKRTDHGTVKCEYLGIESLTPEAGEHDDTARQLAYDHFGGEDAAWEAVDAISLIWDQVKDCGENYGE